MTKVYHVYLIYGKQNHYFASKAAIIDALGENEVGITRKTLSNRVLEEGETLITPRAIIRLGRLVRSSPQKRKDGNMDG